MLNLSHKQAGVSMIELVVGVTIVATLISAGLPSFTQWIQNVQTRGGAEAILNGLQLARNSAVSRNTNVTFNLTGGAGGELDWNVKCTTPIIDLDGDGIHDCPGGVELIQSRSGADGTRNARVGIARTLPPHAFAAPIASGDGLPASVTFNFLGRAATPSVLIPDIITRIDVTNATSATARRMVIVIDGGTIRMCDPELVLADNPQGCA